MRASGCHGHRGNRHHRGGLQGRQPARQLSFEATCNGSERRADPRRSPFGWTPPPPAPRRTWPLGGHTNYPPEMRPLCCGPTQGHSAGTAGRKADCQTRQGRHPRKGPAACLLPTPATRRYSSTPRTPRNSMEPLPIGRRTRASGISRAQERAWDCRRRCSSGHHRCRLQAEKPAHLPSSNITCHWAKRAAHRCRSSSGQPPCGSPSRRAWAPGGHSDRPLEIAPLHCSPAQGCTAAAAGCKAAEKSSKVGPLPRALAWARNPPPRPRRRACTP